MTYRHLCMRDVEVPISISPFYNGQTTDGIEDLGMKGDRIPDYKEIHFEDVQSLTSGLIQVAGLNKDHPTEISFDGVAVDGIKPTQSRFRFTKATVGAGGVNFPITGEDVVAPPTSGKALKVSSCQGKFLPYQD